MKERNEYILAQVSKGITYREIASEFGITSQRIQQIVKKSRKGYNDIKDYWLYILECSNGSLYTGITYSLENRMESHFSGQGAQHTKKFRPISVKFAMCRKSTRWDVLRAEKMVHKTPGFDKRLVNLDEDALNELQEIWLKYRDRQPVLL